MKLRKIKKRINSRLKYLFKIKVKDMLPRKNSILDADEIEYIVILEDSNGKPVGVIANTKSSGLVFEQYSANLYSLITSSGISYTRRALFEESKDENNQEISSKNTP